MIEAVGADVHGAGRAIVIDGAGLTRVSRAHRHGQRARASTCRQLPQPRPSAPRKTPSAGKRSRDPPAASSPAAEPGPADAPELTRLAAAGITSGAVDAAGAIVKGQSALVNVAAPADEPQIGDVGDSRAG